MGLPHSRPNSTSALHLLGQASTLPGLRVDDTAYISESGRFAINLPLSPDTEIRTTTVPGVTLEWTVSTARLGDSAYAVAYTDLPLEVLALGKDPVLESLQTRPLLEDLNWNAIAERGYAISLNDDIPGMEFLHFAEDRYAVLRLYLANRRVYAVMGSSPDLAGMTQVLESFTVDSLWRPYTSTSGRFQVKAPIAPVITTEQLTYQGDLLSWQQFTFYNLAAREDKYQVSYVDLPPTLRSVDPDILLQEVANQLFAALEVPELAETGTAIRLNEAPGREYLTTRPDGKSYVLRLFLVGDRLYGVAAGSRSLSNLDQFVNSFEIQ